jgi:hypothetical protein
VLPDLISTSGCESQAASLHPYIWLLLTEGQGALRTIAGQIRVWTQFLAKGINEIYLFLERMRFGRGTTIPNRVKVKIVLIRFKNLRTIAPEST